MKLWNRGRERERERERRRSEARDWQRRMHEWSSSHPGEPVMQGIITREGSTVLWNGPKPTGEGYGEA